MPIKIILIFILSQISTHFTYYHITNFQFHPVSKVTISLSTNLNNYILISKPSDWNASPFQVLIYSTPSS